MRKTKSSILKAVHDTAKGLQKAGVIDQVALREFDRLCLPPVEPLVPEQIKRIRESSRVSEAVCPPAQHQPVHGAEVGDRPEDPTGTDLKLLHLVQKRGLEVVPDTERLATVQAQGRQVCYPPAGAPTRDRLVQLLSRPHSVGGGGNF